MILNTFDYQKEKEIFLELHGFSTDVSNCSYLWQYIHSKAIREESRSLYFILFHMTS